MPVTNTPPADATVLDLQFTSAKEFFDTVENLVRALPDKQGTLLLMLALGIPTPSARLLLREEDRHRIYLKCFFNAGPGRDFVRHESPTGRARTHEVDLDRFSEPQLSDLDEIPDS